VVRDGGWREFVLTTQMAGAYLGFLDV